MSVDRIRVRLKLDLSKPMTPPVDVLTNGSPSFWRGADMQFELGLFWGDQVLDVANIQSITLELKRIDDRDGDAVMSATLAAAAIDNTVTPTTWADETKTHAIVSFTNVATSLNLGGNTQESFWLVIKALTSNMPATLLVLGAGPVSVEEAGANTSVLAPTDASPPLVTTALGDARYFTRAATNVIPASALRTDADADKIKLANLASEVLTSLTGGLDPANYLGQITALSQALADPATSLGKWYSSVVAGALSGTNNGGITVAIGDRLLSNGTVFAKYSAPPTVLADGIIEKTKLNTSLQALMAWCLGMRNTAIHDGADDYIYGIMDAARRVAFGIGLDGSTRLAAGKFASGSAWMDDYFMMVVDHANKLGYGLRRDGQLEARVVEVVAARGTAASLGARLDAGMFTDGSARSHEYGKQYLRSSRLKLANLRLNATGNLVVALMGDSITDNGYRLATPLARNLISRFGDGGGGWCGLSWDYVDTIGLNSADIDVLYGTRGAAYTRNMFTGHGPDRCEILLSAVGESLTTTIVRAASSARIIFRKQTNGGAFRWRIDTGAWTTVSTAGTPGIGYVHILTGFPVGACALSIECETPGGGCWISGVDIRRNQAGVVVHKLGVSGERTDHLTANTYWDESLQLLAPDIVTLFYGTNDRSVGMLPETFGANLESIIDRIRVKLPLADICVIVPCDNGVSGTYAMSLYRSAAQAVAAKKATGCLDLGAIVGPYATSAPSSDGSTRNLFENDGIHPNAAGGAVITESVLRILEA